MDDVLKSGLVGIGTGGSTDRILRLAGYSYDPVQNIFYSNMDAWQRNFGYCYLYDEAAPVLGMIIDSEPIYFNYGGKRWMVEFWKGQYALTTGCEIGIYNTEKPPIDVPGVFNGTFYHCVSDSELLNISFVLKKQGKILFSRDDAHWWLTGFILGEFSEPWELTMDIKITLRDHEMCQAFLYGLKRIGYHPQQYSVVGNTVSLLYDKPYSPQPITRTPLFEMKVQRRNKLMCQVLQELFRDEAASLKGLDQQMYNLIRGIGKNKLLYEKYDQIKEYIR